jgi:CubicO group peptidase (beta-lactamase class C family)
VRRSSLACLVILVGCAHAPPTPTPAASLDEAIARAHKDLDERVRNNGWPDLAVGVVIDDQLAYFEAFGVRDPIAQDAITPHTLFRLASLTKLFTGMAILQLRDQGKLDLDDPVDKYLPEIDGVVYPTSEHPPIRIRHLVTHTSGLPRDGNRFEGMTEADVVKGLAGMALEFTPGSATSYSNYGMALAGIIVARVSGVSYRDYMQQAILTPLGMSESVWQVSDARVPVATGMTWDRELKGYRPIKKELIGGALEPAGGLYSNIHDLAKFAAFEMAAWPPRDGAEQPPLSRSSTRESQLTAGPVVPGGGLPGVNWWVRGGDLGQLDSHTGKLEGYRSEIALLPRRRVGILVFLCESHSDEAIDDVTKVLLQAFGPLRPEPPPSVGKDLREATERLTAWLDHPSRDTAATVFVKEFLDSPNLSKTAFQAVSSRGGDCRFDRFTEGWNSRGTVKMVCKNADWTFHVQIQPMAPHLITGWWW